MKLEDEQIMSRFNKAGRLMKSAEILFSKGLEDKSAQVINHAQELHPGILYSLLDPDGGWDKSVRQSSGTVEDLISYLKK